MEPVPTLSNKEVVNEELRAECVELRRRIAAIPRATQNAAVRISELEKALHAIRQARDTTLSQVHILTQRLDVAEGRVEEMALERESMVCITERAQGTLESATRESEQLRGLLRTMEEQHRAALAELEARYREMPAAVETLSMKRQSEQLAVARKKIVRVEERLKRSEERQELALAELTEKLAGAERERRMAEGTVEELRLALEQQSSERELMRQEQELREQQHTAEMAELEGRLTATVSRTKDDERVMEQLASAERRLAAVDAYFEKTQAHQRQANAKLVENCVTANQARRAAEEKAKEFRARLEEVSAREMATRRELEELRAEAAEAPRVETPATGLEAAEQLEQQRHQLAELSAQLDAARDELRLAWAVKTEASEPAPVELTVVEAEMADEPMPQPLAGPAAREALENLESILAVAVSAADPTEAIQLLLTQTQEFAQRTLCAGSIATYRLISVCSEVVLWMVKAPAKIATMHKPLAESFQLLARLAESGDASAEADTNDTSVYIVDDDLDNCDCIATALDKMGLKTRYASNPELAVQHLATQPYDLIILDVDLGGANGFEVYVRLREIAHLRRTPVLFCSGLNSAQVQAKELEGTRVAFLAKPYTLHGLGLKALGMIVAARIPA